MQVQYLARPDKSGRACMLLEDCKEVNAKCTSYFETPPKLSKLSKNDTCYS